jgi:hypothetical protein
MTTSTSERLPLLRTMTSPSRSEDVVIETRHPRMFDFATSFSKKIRLLNGVAIVASFGVLMWICLTPLVHSRIKSDAPRWSDAHFYQWESFLNDHFEDATAGAVIKMKQRQIPLKPANDLLYLNNTRAIQLLRHGIYDAAADFFSYQQGWEVQINQAYCAIATSASVLNSYRGTIDLPQDPLYLPFPWATQMALVENECVTAAVLDIDSVRHAGLGIAMVPNLLNCFLMPKGFEAVAYPVDPEFSVQHHLKDIVVNALLDKNSRVVLNYDRGGIGQGPIGHGHWSPIGAYSQEIDSFLIMDVAKYKYPPVWVPTNTLFGGVGTLDLCSAMQKHLVPIDWSQDFKTITQELGCTPGYRGFVVISPVGASL